MIRPAVILVAAALTLAAQTRYQPTWDSINSRPTPAWFQEAKFGIFIHWGLYSVPSFAPTDQKGQTPYAEWYWNSLASKKAATVAFHNKTYGEGFQYDQFEPMFKAELFEPDRWADVFLHSGAKYVVLTSKHHDGFALWPSAEADRDWGRKWNAVSAGPHRDLLGDLTEAVRRKGIRMGFYYSLYEWYNPLWLTDKQKFVSEHLHPQFKDAVTRYKPSIIFSDGEWELPSDQWRSPELLAWLFNDSPCKDEVVIDDRWGKETRHKDGGYFTTEYTAGLDSGTHPWEESRGMGLSYGYNRNEHLETYRTSRELILMLVDLVSRGGNLLLDIGPTADGRIPVIMEERLTQMGEWLKVNGDAIYGTKPWKRSRQFSSGEVPKLDAGKQFMTRYEITDYVDRKKPGQAVIEAFFTMKGNDVYAIFPEAPRGDWVMQDVAPAANTRVVALGSQDQLKWDASGNGMRVHFPQAGGPVAIRVTGLR
jgi:alpha-L-fucosidase